MMCRVIKPADATPIALPYPQCVASGSTIALASSKVDSNRVASARQGTFAKHAEVER